MDYSILWDELTTDPAGIGYADPTNTANDFTNVGLINDDNQTAQHDTLPAAQIYEQTNATEFMAKTEAQKAFIRDIWGLGQEVYVADGSKARAVYLTVFGAQSETVQTLAAALDYTTNRAAILGLGRVYVHDIKIARARYG